MGDLLYTKIGQWHRTIIFSTFVKSLIVITKIEEILINCCFCWGFLGFFFFGGGGT